MKKLWLLLFVLLPAVGMGQVITTIAGNGVAANTGDGTPASASSINYPVGGVFDKFGNYYFGTGNQGNGVRKINPSGIITTVVGTGSVGYSGDWGPATLAKLKNVQEVTVDTFGNLYLTDMQNNRIRMVNVSTGIISTIAGTGTAAFGGDGGQATAAQLNSPSHLCFDKQGNLFVSDAGNYRIRKISPAGIITTIAGNGVPGFGGNAVPATAVPINTGGLCIDTAGNLYFSDDLSRVFKIDVSGFINYHIGNGTGGYSGDGGPASTAQLIPNWIATDKLGNFFITDRPAPRIRWVNSSGIISTIVGTGVAAYSGDGGPATSAEIVNPFGVALDSCGNLFVADGHNWRIRKVTFNPSCNPTLETKQIKPFTEISIYPNPASTELTISAPGKIKEVRVYNLLGQIGARSVGNREREVRISVAGISPGIYFVRIVDEDGGVMVRRVVKE